MVPLWSTLLLTNFSVRRISFCHTNINIFRLAQKSSSKRFSSAKHELGIYIFGGKAIEREGTLEPSTWTGNWKRTTLKKSTVSSYRFVDNVPLWRGYAKKWAKKFARLALFSVWKGKHFFHQSSSRIIFEITKTADISRCHQFSREMTSEKRAQKVGTDDVPLPRSE